MDSSTGKHKRPLQIYWAFIGLGLGIVIGASTKEWAASLISGILMGVGMAIMANKQGVDQ